MKRVMTLICVVLALFASTAHSDNLLDKLKAAAKKAEQEKAIQYQSAADAANPVVLTVDGIDKNAVEGGALDKFLLGKKNKRFESSYLKPVVDGWALSADASFFGWSGDYAQTESELRKLKARIISNYSRASSEGRPFVMITHSWGTVLSYRALKDLYADGKLPENAVHSLVTLGSPLSKEDEPNQEGKSQAAGPSFGVVTTLSGAVKEYGEWVGPEVLDDVVGSWRNYWIKGDLISGPIRDPKTNPSTRYLGFNAHKAYYTAPSISSKIRTDLISDLEKFVSPVATVASTDSISRQNPPAPTPAPAATLASTKTQIAQNTALKAKERHSGFDLFGLQLGMTYSRAFAVLNERMPGVTEDKFRYKGAAGKEYWSQESYFSTDKRYSLFLQRQNCVEHSLPEYLCVHRFTASDIKPDSQIYLDVALIEDVLNNSGDPVIHGVLFTHVSDRMEPFQAVQRRYGPPDRDNRYYEEARGFYRATKRGKMCDVRYKPRKNPEPCVIATDIPANEYYWDILSPIGNGTLVFCEGSQRGRESLRDASGSKVKRQKLCRAVKNRKSSRPGDPRAEYSINLFLDPQSIADLKKRRDEALKDTGADDSPF